MSEGRDGYRKQEVEPFYLAFGQTVRYMRLCRGMKQHELARLIGYKHSMISQLENGQLRVKLLTADKIAAALGTTVETLWPDRARLPVQPIPRQLARRAHKKGPARDS